MTGEMTVAVAAIESKLGFLTGDFSISLFYAYFTEFLTPPVTSVITVAAWAILSKSGFLTGDFSESTLLVS